MADDGTYQAIADAGRALIAATADFVAALEQPPPPPPVPPPPVKAFPTAEGFGAGSIGGRGDGFVTPQILRVTNLQDTGPGSFRSALTATGPRFVVFDVAGVIELATPITVAEPYLYVAGQTAPHGGICVRAAAGNTKSCLVIRASHCTFRHVRVRPGFQGDRYPGPTRGSAGEASHAVLYQGHSQHTIWDHCSFSWATDEVFTTDEGCQDFTLQWSIIAEPLHNAGHGKGPHGRALSHSYSEDIAAFGPGGHVRLSDHHNLVAHAQNRAPNIATGAGQVEFVNNVVHHVTEWATGLNTAANGSATAPKARVTGNWYQRLPHPSHREVSYLGPPSNRAPGSRLYVHGNVGKSRPTGTEDHWLSVAPDDRSPAMGGTATDDPTTVADPLCTTTSGANPGVFPWPEHLVTATTARDAYDAVLAAAGATVPARDAVDARVVARAAADTVPVPGGPNGGLLDHPGQLVTPPDFANRAAGYPDLTTGGTATLWAAPANPMSAAPNGYLTIENALNALAGDPIP